MSNSEARFAVGQQFLQYRGGTTKIPAALCTVTDIHRTYNATGELVKLRYVTRHEFCGQSVYDMDVVDTTIARGIALLNERAA